MNDNKIIVDFNGNNNVYSTRADGSKEVINYQNFCNWFAKNKVTSTGVKEDDIYFNFQFTSPYIKGPIIVRVLKEYKDKYKYLLDGLNRLSNNIKPNIIKISRSDQIKNLKKYSGTSALKKRNNKGKAAIVLCTLSAAVTAIFAGYAIAYNNNSNSNDTQNTYSQEVYNNNDKLKYISPETFQRSIEVAKKSQEKEQINNNQENLNDNLSSYDILNSNIDSLNQNQNMRR